MPQWLLNKEVQAIYIDIINVGEMVALNDDEQAIINFYDMIKNHGEICVEFARSQDPFVLEWFRMGQTIDSSVVGTGLGEMGARFYATGITNREPHDECVKTFEVPVAPATTLREIMRPVGIMGRFFFPNTGRGYRGCRDYVLHTYPNPSETRTCNHTDTTKQRLEHNWSAA